MTIYTYNYTAKKGKHLITVKAMRNCEYCIAMYSTCLLYYAHLGNTTRLKDLNNILSSL